MFVTISLLLSQVTSTTFLDSEGCVAASVSARACERASNLREETKIRGEARPEEGTDSDQKIQKEERRAQLNNFVSPHHYM